MVNQKMVFSFPKPLEPYINNIKEEAEKLGERYA
jgi:hypothetical protein